MLLWLNCQGYMYCMKDMSNAHFSPNGLQFEASRQLYCFWWAIILKLWGPANMCKLYPASIPSPLTTSNQSLTNHKDSTSGHSLLSINTSKNIFYTKTGLWWQRQQSSIKEQIFSQTVLIESEARWNQQKSSNETISPNLNFDFIIFLKYLPRKQPSRAINSL